MSEPFPEPAVATQTDHDDPVLNALRRVCRKIAPVWPLERFVAVNPYLGLKDQSFDEAAHVLAQTAGARATLPASFYLDATDDGRITRADLAAALDARSNPPADSVDALLQAVRESGTTQDAAFRPEVPTVADVAHAETGTDWGRLATDRVSSWAGAYFDDGQALWRSADDSRPLFAAWKAEAEIDRTPEVMGLKGFRTSIAGLPESAPAAARHALCRLDVPGEGLDLYLHRLLLRIGGWAAYAARIVWNARLYDDRDDDSLLQLLAVQLCWEAALLDTLPHPGVRAEWDAARHRLMTLSPSPDRAEARERFLTLQDAFDRAVQRRLVDDVNTGASAASDGTSAVDGTDARPDVQAIFCIDVRSEVFRRHLEAVAPSAETIGFAGFFGFPIEYVPIGHETGGAQCPVLLTPEHTILEQVSDSHAADRTVPDSEAPDPEATERAASRRRRSHHVKRAWNAFKMGAISCFSFVGPVGLAYLPKMISDTMGWTRTVPTPDASGLDGDTRARKAPSLAAGEHCGSTAGMPLDDRIDTAEGALRAMSLTEGFAPLVMITGHGATTVNNPYDTGLHCGACGGRTGEANARVAAAVLNDPAVRDGLAERGIRVPDDTFFLACQHDTTTDAVSIFNRADVPASHRDRLHQLERWLDEAGQATRAERAQRFHFSDTPSVDRAVVRRSTDWAQVRPEWGLAGHCTGQK